MGRPKVSVAVVGGGVTGLATAHYVEQVAREDGWDLTGVLVEQEPRVGGKLLTVAEDGFLVDGGPDSVLAQKPWALQIIRELGMEDDLLVPSAHGVSMLHGGRLHAVPEGLIGVVPTRPRALWRASFLSLRGKVRASLEPLVRRRRQGEDESLASFLRRRLGAEVAQRLVEPFVAGNHAGDAKELSLRALYPTLAQWEERYGSLTRGIRAARAQSPASGGSAFCSLRSGMASLPRGIVSHLRRFSVRLGSRVTGITSDHGGERSGFHVALAGNDVVKSDFVVVAVPAGNAAALVRPIAPKAASLLDQMTFASTASIGLAFRCEAVSHPLNGSGFLVPRAEPSPVTACTWSSSKWPGRNPAGYVLLRAFIGWSRDSSLLGRDDPAMVRVATEALRPLLGLQGEPERSWVHRWPLAMPQYRVGHLAWLDSIDEALEQCPGLVLAGASYRGVGVPDCVRQAQEAAQRIRASVSQRQQTSQAGPQGADKSPALNSDPGR